MKSSTGNKTEYFTINPQNFVKIFRSKKFAVKSSKPNIAYPHNPHKQCDTEGRQQSYEKTTKKRYYLSKKELSKLLRFSWENCHFFFRKTFSETPAIFLSKYKVVFSVSRFIIFMQKVYEIFGLSGCEISRHFTEKKDTLFHKKLLCKTLMKKAKEFNVHFLKSQFDILSLKTNLFLWVV